MHKVIKGKVVVGFFCFLVDVSVCVCLMSGVKGVCGVFCVSNVQRQQGSQTLGFV
jgi:hypothetical protein